jgi:glycosyltransferase involved in cell wall biosynthesis
MRTNIIIPALNEAESLKHVLSEIPDEVVSEVILVDGGSTDDTVRIAKAGGARVVIEKQRGYGLAFTTGVNHSDGDILVFMDGDGANNPSQIPALINPIQTGQADMVLGSRLVGYITPGAMPWHQRLGNQLSARLIHLLYELPITDLSPFRAVNREKLLTLDLKDMTYGWPTEMIVKAARQKWRILEIPVNHRSRIGGKSKISGTFQGTVLATLHILSTIIYYSR